MQKPVFEIGDYVVVEVRKQFALYSNWFPNQTSTEIFQGEMVKGEAYDPSESFRMTGSAEMPIRVVAWKNVVSFNGEPITLSEQPKTPRRVVQYKGSKGAEYDVTIEEDGRASCTCSGFGFRHKCSHIDKVRQQLSLETQ